MQAGPNSKDKPQESSGDASSTPVAKEISVKTGLLSKKGDIKEFFTKRLENIEESIASLKIRNNPPHCNPPTSLVHGFYEEEAYLKVRVAMLPILLEAIAGNKKCQLAYENLRPLVGAVIDPSIKTSVVRMSTDKSFDIQIRAGGAPRDQTIDVPPSGIKKGKSFIQKQILATLDQMLVRSIGYLADSKIDLSLTSTPADLPRDLDLSDENSCTVKTKTSILLGAYYPYFLRQAVIDDLALYTTGKAKEALREIFQLPVDLTEIEGKMDHLLFFVGERDTKDSDLYGIDPNEHKPTIVHEDIWGFLKADKLTAFLEAVDEANLYCWQKSLPDGTRKIALDRYLKRFDLDSMMEYLESEAERQSLAAVSAPKPKEEKAKPAENGSVDPALDLKVKVPESISALLQQNFPEQKASEVLKVGRRIVEDGLRYNASESDLLELIGRFKGLSLKEVGHKIHSVLSEQGSGGVTGTSTESMPVGKREGGMKLREALEKSVILLLKNAPDYKAVQQSIAEELSKVPGAKPDEEITRYLNEGLLIPTGGEGDELMLNPAYWD